MADDVTDDDRGGAIALHERFVPVTARLGGLPGGQVAHHYLHVVRLGGAVSSDRCSPSAALLPMR
ncbi:hypothetical protein [uncultured Modestobacter sp.]|uniref:hypothetical protein n=1 Tax=uncultured Modestobacter sp. TaxID=380048 RepID=UPI002616A342|nr:hypothetical protein [uncultured Modestobacter sp.]